MIWYSPARGAQTFAEHPIAPQACSELGECKRLRYEPDPFEGVAEAQAEPDAGQVGRVSRAGWRSRS